MTLVGAVEDRGRVRPADRAFGLRSSLAKPGPTGLDDGLGAVCHPELGEDVRNVVADGLLAQMQSMGDLGVGLVIEHIGLR